MKETGEKIIVKYVQDSINKGTAIEEKGPNASRNGLQTTTLLEGLEEGKYDAALGGARRDEEKARAKERFFSHRDDFGQWDPKTNDQNFGTSLTDASILESIFRVFPISNWTEMDVWQYILHEKIALPSLYFAHRREVIDRDGVLLAKVNF